MCFIIIKSEYYTFIDIINHLVVGIENTLTGVFPPDLSILKHDLVFQNNFKIETFFYLLNIIFEEDI